MLNRCVITALFIPLAAQTVLFDYPVTILSGGYAAANRFRRRRTSRHRLFLFHGQLPFLWRSAR